MFLLPALCVTQIESLNVMCIQHLYTKVFKKSFCKYSTLEKCCINVEFYVNLFMLYLIQHLSEKRLLAGRFERLEELTREQLLDEKVAVQKALLYLEGIFGRPVTRGDRDLVRPLYDRYRALKRLVIRSGPVSKCLIILH